MDKAVSYFEKALYLGLECAMDEITAIKTFQRDKAEYEKNKVPPLSIFYTMLLGPVYFLARQRYDFAFLNVWFISLLIISLQHSFPKLQFSGWVIGNFLVSLFIIFSRNKNKNPKNKDFNILF